MPLCRGTVLHAVDQASDYLMVVLQGEVIVRYPGSRGVPLSERKETGHLIEPSKDALSGECNSSSICAQDCIILYMPKVGPHALPTTSALRWWRAVCRVYEAYSLGTRTGHNSSVGHDSWTCYPLCLGFCLRMHVSSADMLLYISSLNISSEVSVHLLGLYYMHRRTAQQRVCKCGPLCFRGTYVPVYAGGTGAHRSRIRL